MLRRSIHTTLTSLLPRNARRANPGVGYQIQELGEDQELAADAEGFGDIETDFMDVHRTHRQHENELMQQRDKVRRFMIKHKYFRDDKLPNLLTYAEKEQIRLLHTRDPEEWTVERLAESFPATPIIVQKILKTKWRPRSTKRIRSHDEGVVRNWEEIRAGKSELPSELLNHLSKFADRKIEDLQASVDSWPTRPVLPKPSGEEFLSIITSCSKYAKKSNHDAEKRVQLMAPNQKAQSQTNHSRPTVDDEDTYLLEKVHDKRKMRLQELKQLKLTPNDLINSSSNNNNINIEQSAVESLRNPNGTGILPIVSAIPNSSSNYIEKFQSSEIVISAEDRKRFEMTSVKDRIHIPRKVWSKGATYRVEDAYYDDDGEFLYRVPGMTGKWI